ncbi:Invasion protein B, involved in pathogenesis [Jannaschia seosinensis]|uniref:Invasion protein B, involved in pathogenesis n=1 Tax=Jannaschia seosinensis TaxID=313367 RepID=A0A0M7B771_9RHOB|nr:invasion associated locus B family protein [Jannaschia seosinensis]CUH20890.1 Invasion protein B, involved in pathogenesis [Jannaschia seosinensis]
MTDARTCIAVLLATVALLTGPVQAQDTEAAEEAVGAESADTPEPSMPALPGGDLSTGREIGEALGGGPEIYVREEHGDWEVRCLEAPEGQDDPCQLYQRLTDQQGNPTADVNFFDLPDAAGDIVAGATVLTPLQTLLTEQVTLKVDGGQPRRYPFSFCDQSGCYARMGFTQADVDAFKRGAMATLVVVPALAPDQEAVLEMSLSGFTAGLNAVEAANE